MYTVKFEKVTSKCNCGHKILIVSKDYELDYHSSSPIHYGVCPQCHKGDNWEIRHMDYVVVGCNNEELKYPYFVEFSCLFEYDVEYTEKQIVEKLVEVYKPSYIMNGKRCLYSETSGIHEEVLWK